MGKLLGAIGGLIKYLCLGCVVAQVAGLAWLGMNGHLEREKLVKLLAVAQDVDIAALEAPSPGASAAAKTTAGHDEPPKHGWDKPLNLDALSVSLQNARTQLRTDQRKFADDYDTFTRAKNDFTKQLDTTRTQLVDQRREDVRTILENVKPKQSKDLILKMLKDDEMDVVVALLIAMPPAKRTKIVTEFKTEEEMTRLNDVLREMRTRDPQIELIDKAKEQVGGVAAAAPETTDEPSDTPDPNN